MKKIKIDISIEEYVNGEHLPEIDEMLIGHANQALETSYAPYSRFHVGAAILLSDGKIIKGSNQENAAYPSGLCAERVAIFQAKSSFPDSTIQAIAIAAKADHFEKDSPVTPCGACRQVIAEMQSRQESKIRIIMRGQKGGTYITDGIENLLPLMFKEEKLKKSNK
ncbi:MAG TPA: cytidine deaminase [Bacteroidales bacterium]